MTQNTDLRSMIVRVARDQAPRPGLDWATPEEIIAAGFGAQLVVPTFTIGAEDTNVRLIEIQFKNRAGANIDYVQPFLLAVFSSAAMTALSSGGSTGLAIGTDGLLEPLVAKKIFLGTCEATGHWDGTWTDTATAAACLAVMGPGGVWTLSDAFANT